MNSRVSTKLGNFAWIKIRVLRMVGSSGYYKNESMVSLVSRRYMRGENGKESLVVCLSEYLPLHSLYHILTMSMIAV